MTDAPQAGLGVDATGGPVVDPTKNVLDLVGAEGRRQDDLRAAAEKLSNVKHAHAKHLIEINASHARELREAETKRLDAIRAVDTAAASVLANQVATSASTLRDLVATTAAAAATAAAGIYNPLAERIAQLERSSYEGSGKSAVADPMMARMVETLESLRTNMAEGEGGKASRTERRSSNGATIAIVMAVFAFLSLMIAATTVAVVLSR